MKKGQKREYFFDLLLISTFLVLIFSIFLTLFVLKKDPFSFLSRQGLLTKNTLPPEAREKRGVLLEDIPAEFPEDFPIFPNSSLLSVWKTQEEGMTGISIVWEIDSEPFEALSFYKKELMTNGWKITSENTEDEDSLLLAFEKERTSGFLGITTLAEKVVISLTLGIKD